MPKWDEIGGEREKKNYTPEFCSYPTRARKFKIKNRKKIQKIKKVNSDIILSKTGWERARMRKKKLIPEFRSYSTRARKKRKKKAKKFKKLKKPFPALLLAKMG